MRAFLLSCTLGIPSLALVYWATTINMESTGLTILGMLMANGATAIRRYFREPYP